MQTCSCGHSKTSLCVRQTLHNHINKLIGKVINVGMITDPEELLLYSHSFYTVLSYYQQGHSCRFNCSFICFCGRQTLSNAVILYFGFVSDRLKSRSSHQEGIFFKSPRGIKKVYTLWKVVLHLYVYAWQFCNCLEKAYNRIEYLKCRNPENKLISNIYKIYNAYFQLFLFQDSSAFL